MQPGSGRRAHGAAAVLAALAAAFAAAPHARASAAAPRDTEAAARSLIDELRERVRVRDERGEALLDRVAAAPAGERAALWRALGAEPALDGDVRAALLDAARALASPADGGAHVVDSSRAARAVAGLEVLRSCGRASELALVTRVALAGAGTRRDGELARGIETAARAILERDEDAWEALEGVVDALPLRLVERMLAAVGQCRSPHVLPALALFLDRDPALDRAALSYVARACRDGAPGLEDDLRLQLRRFLEAPDAPVREQAALVVGWLEDEDATARLVDLLDDDARAVQSSARWALERISGLSYPADDPRWREWHESELAWWSERAPTAFADLRSRDRARAADAVHEIAKRRLFRKSLVRELEPIVRAEERGISTLACRALGALESRDAIPVLLDALDAPDGELSRAAAAALGAITGLEAPPSRSGWVDALARAGSG